MNSTAAPVSAEGRPYGDAEADATYRKVFWRIIPFLILCYLFNFLDRINVAFAKLQFTRELHFSEAVYGLGSGIFYIGYSLFEVPSNLMLDKIGIRKTLVRIMVLWGLFSALTAFMRTPQHYYIIRTLLGAAEAGFFPGILFYVTQWVPAGRRARITALFFMSVPFSGIIGGPLSGWVMHSLSGFHGFEGWQWLFLL
jgi:MFS family permease